MVQGSCEDIRWPEAGARDETSSLEPGAGVALLAGVVDLPSERVVALGGLGAAATEGVGPCRVEQFAAAELAGHRLGGAGGAEAQAQCLDVVLAVGD